MLQRQSKGFQHPFGEVSCEHEIEVLRERYQEYYYDQSPFNTATLNQDTYLIVGRRGCGKTSISKYLTFQNKIKGATCIDVDEPDVYNAAFQEVAYSSARYSIDITTRKIEKIWEYLLWSLVFNQYENHDPVIKKASLLNSPKDSVAYVASNLLKQILTRLLGDNGKLANEVENLCTSTTFTKAKDKVLTITEKEPVIIAIDTIERYDPFDDALMATVTGLIQCANRFNISFAPLGIHVKVFMSGEIYPHLLEAVIPNPSKQVRYPVFLMWRPKDLIHLISWRLYRYLTTNGMREYLPKKVVNWNRFRDVLENMWFPFFGDELINLRGLTEKSFPYILRHTQMRPRQLVILCNNIARTAINQGVFPNLKQLPIPEIIRESELSLAIEVLNSYERIYPNVSRIVDALRTFPMTFDGKDLDKVASTTASAWSKGTYSPVSFRQLVAELGIVGRIRSYDQRSGIISADFEYHSPDRLGLTSNDKCVIHPMFYSKLQIRRDSNVIVYPFPDHPDFTELVKKRAAPLKMSSSLAISEEGAGFLHRILAAPETN